jgi:hypothetical protein
MSDPGSGRPRLAQLTEILVVSAHLADSFEFAAPCGRALQPSTSRIAA